MIAAAPTQDTNNNFHLLRLVFALMVVVYHIPFVSQVTAWAGLTAKYAIGAELGVQGFFVLSGYLVYASIDRSASVGVYAQKRFRRLYPAYAVVILACAAAALIASPEARTDIEGVARYLGWNLVFLNFMAPELPGLFASNPMSEVNGALWTIKIEVMFYLILPVLAFVLNRAGMLRWPLIVLIYAAAEAWRFGLEHLAADRDQPLLDEVARQLPGQMAFFITGVGLYLARGAAWRWRTLAAVAGAGLLAASLLTPEAEPARALGLGLVVIWLATGLPRIFDAAAYGDVSYGVYIVHFPIVQGLVAAGAFAADPWIASLGAMAASLIVALVLWHAVERPALRADSAYRHR